MSNKKVMFVNFVKLKSFKRRKIIFVGHSSQKCVLFSFKLLVADLCSELVRDLMKQMC